MKNPKEKEECRQALIGYLETSEVIEEDEMENFIIERLKAKGVEKEL